MSTRMTPRSGVGHGKLESGGSGGGGFGGFAPNPGAPGGRPPTNKYGVPTAPMGSPKGVTFPTKRKGTWTPSAGLLREIARKANALQRNKEHAEQGGGWLDWMWPESALKTPSGYDLGGDWVRCARPLLSCDVAHGPPTHQWRQAGTLCISMGTCPTGQAFPMADPPVSPVGAPVPTTLGAIWLVKKTGQSGTSNIGTIVSSWRRNVPGSTKSPWKVGFVLLPEQFEDPFAEPQVEPLEKTLARSRPRVDIRTRPWHQPAIEFSPASPPGGTNVPHVPLPPRPGDREIKQRMDYGVTGKFYGALTEFRDMMDCFAEASGMKKPKGPIGERARKIYEHLNAKDPNGDPKHPIDAGAFAACMALENAKDFAIGKLSSQTAKNLNKSPYVAPRPGGYRGGGWSTRMHNS